jgi:hypothetical protein
MITSRIFSWAQKKKKKKKKRKERKSRLKRKKKNQRFDWDTSTEGTWNTNSHRRMLLE